MIRAGAAQGLSNPTLALNLSTATDYGGGERFLDLMLAMRPFIGHKPGKWGGMDNDALEAGGYLDADGWPTRIPPGIDKIGTVWKWTNEPGAAAARKGVYVLGYEGEGTLKVSGDARIISSEPGRIVFESLTGSANLYLDILATDPDRTGDHVRDITLVAQKNLDLFEAGAVFNPDWIDIVEDARQLRFMDWNRTNNSDVVSWDDRASPDGPNNGTRAVEDMVRLANEVGADPWFAMPHLADADYIRQFATYVRDHLDPALTVRAEYSNEVWNGAFAQARWVKAQSKAEWGVEAPYDYAVKKAVETALIWEDVFADEPARLVNVLGTWTARPEVTETLLNPAIWRAKEPGSYVAPADVFEELGITGYFGRRVMADKAARAELLRKIRNPDIDAKDWLADKLLDDGYKGSMGYGLEDARENKAVADRYGLGTVSYEGGQHVHHSFSIKGVSNRDIDTLTKFMTGFVRSPEMADLYREHWKEWARIGDGPYMQFGDLSSSSKYGSWGLYEVLGVSTPRAKALIALNEATTPWWDGAAGGDHYRQGIVAKGGAGNDTLVGTTQEDYLLGFAGDDTFVPGAGDDGVNGGAGTDRVILSGDPSDYALKVEGAGYRLTGPDGSDFLIGVEKLTFGDGDGRTVTIADLAQGPDGTLRLTGPAGPPAPDAPDAPDTDAGDPPPPVVPPVVPASLEAAFAAAVDPGGSVIAVVRAGTWLARDLDAAGRGDAPSWAVYTPGATATFGGVTVKADSSSLFENSAPRGGPALSESALATAQTLGSVITGPSFSTGPGIALGGAGNDSFHGQADGDAVRLGGGNDTALPRAGNDTVWGEDGNDMIRAGPGDDVLIGGAGNDVLKGEAGRDRFVFAIGDGADSLADLERGDILDLGDWLAPGQTLASVARDTGPGLMLDNGDDTILLDGLHAADLAWIAGLVEV